MTFRIPGFLLCEGGLVRIAAASQPANWCTCQSKSSNCVVLMSLKNDRHTYCKEKWPAGPNGIVVQIFVTPRKVRFYSDSQGEVVGNSTVCPGYHLLQRNDQHLWQVRGALGDSVRRFKQRAAFSRLPHFHLDVRIHLGLRHSLRKGLISLRVPKSP